MPVRTWLEGEIVRVEYVGSPSDDELRGFFRDLAGLVARVPRYVIVYDMRRAVAPKASQRRLLAACVAELAPSMRTHCVHLYFVFDSALLWAALRVMLWIQPMILPHTVCASLYEAELLARSELERESDARSSSGE